MKRFAAIIWALLFLTFVSGALAAIVVQDGKPRIIKRVNRPHFSEHDWDGIYFENLFKDGLVGVRPNPTAKTTTATVSPREGESENPGSETGIFSWSKYISGTTIEDEVKTLQTRLNQEITTPVKFKSDYAKVHQSYSILSMLFGVVREFDGDVRWKKFAGEAQVSFERAAANSRVGTIQAYESCKRRKEDLQELVRGGNFPSDDKRVEMLDWSVVVGRSPIMDRLQTAYDELKLMTANKGEFNNEIEKAFHESQMAAAIAQVMMRENMESADDEGYLEFAKQLSDAAVSVSKACETEDYTGAAAAVNLMGQSCSNCHDEWR